MNKVDLVSNQNFSQAFFWGNFVRNCLLDNDVSKHKAQVKLLCITRYIIYIVGYVK